MDVIADGVQKNNFVHMNVTDSIVYELVLMPSKYRETRGYWDEWMIHISERLRILGTVARSISPFVAAIFLKGCVLKKKRS